MDGVNFRDLYEEILDYEGTNLYADVLERWKLIGRAQLERLARYRRRNGTANPYVVVDDELWDFYALSRISDLLLAPFQADAEHPWDGPAVTVGQYVEFFEALGLAAFRGGRFSPLRHEIVEVEADEGPLAVGVLKTFWPGLMFGQMLFSRGGVRVRARPEVLDPEIASRFTLYFAHRRLRRPTQDLSVGWGHNSQWRTRFHRSYEEPDHLHLNVDGKVDLFDMGLYRREGRNYLDPNEDLSLAERRELLLHRSFVSSRRRNDDLWPYNDMLTVRRSGQLWPLDENLLEPALDEQRRTRLRSWARHPDRSPES